mmetsp:Transcript_88008/g.172169  ORF Transcript_88008/g.172169 Transcript_88008/m.172169 type:complete len:831 (-) Transcript_88008:5093-7585(-)
MVSWFRFYCEHWQVFCAENSPDGHIRAAEAHQAFLTIDDADQLMQWTQDRGSDIPGVFLVARNKVGRDGKRKIDVMHHLKVIHHEGGEWDDYVVGVLQLGGGSHMNGLLVKDLTADLVPAAGKRSGTRGGSGGAKDSTIYVPSLESMMEKRDGFFGKNYVPKVGEECTTSEDLACRPSVVFIPFYLWIVICTGTNPNKTSDSDEDNDPIEEMSTKDEEEIWVEQANCPQALAQRLARMMRVLREEDIEMFNIYHGVAQNILDFLWAANNNLTSGIRLRSTDGDLEAMKHTQMCLQDFLSFAEEGTLTAWKRNQQAEQDQLLVPRHEQEPVVQAEEQQQPASKDDKTGVRSKPISTLPPSPKGESTRPIGSPPQIIETQGPPAWLHSFMKGLEGTMAEVGFAIREAAQVNRSAKEKEEEKKKATSKWLPDSMFVLRVLSAENGWDTPGIPELNQFASKLFEMKLLQAIQFVRAKAKDEGWSGCILKSGLSEFLKRGPIAEDIREAPSGFSVLFFYHSAYSEGDDEAHSMQALREVYGDGEMPDDLVKAFSKLHIFVPTCTFRAGEQIKAAIQFLEAVCGEKTIATSGYRYGLRLLEEHRRLFEREADRDKMFLFNYLYLLDRMFQQFCREIREYSQEQDPVLTLKETLRRDRGMRGMIDQAMEPLVIYGKELGLRPPIKLQDRSSLSGLIDMSQVGKVNPSKRPVEDLDGGGKAGGKVARRRVGVEPHPDWWYELSSEDCIREWAIPHSKKFGDYFGPHKKENVVGLPYVQHHKTKRPAPICLKYQLGNGVKCKRGADCVLAHIRPRDLSSEEYRQITEHLKKVYQTGGQS